MRGRSSNPAESGCRHGNKKSVALTAGLFFAVPYDVWSAFDLATSPEVGASGVLLRRRLARVIERLRLRSSQVSGLPDHYALALKSGAFATDFDPEHPDRPFLPPDLLDPNGQWVEIGEDGLGAVAPFHVQ